MGNDGGSIPTRRELVKEAARAPTAQQIKETRAEQQTHNWRFDAVSEQPLREPVVSDARGRLYNKATILEFLVEGKWREEMAGTGIGGMGDVAEVRFSRGAEEGGEDRGWVCPVSGEKLGAGNGGVKAVYLVPCGHAFAASVIKAVQTGAGGKCLVCEKEYAGNDVVVVLPVAEADIARLELRVKRLREEGLSHSLKKVKSKGEKKRKHRETAEATANTESAKTTKSHKDDPDGHNVDGDHENSHNDSINSAATARVTAKVVAEQEQAKKRKVLQSGNVASLFSSSNPKGSSTFGKNNDYMTRGFTVPAGKR